jgi:hypothetical protein
MELISLDLSLYIDDKYSILNDPYVRMMVLAIGYEVHILCTSGINYNDLHNKKYSSILRELVKKKITCYSSISFPLLIYAIVRYRYPDRKVCMLYSQLGIDGNGSEIELYYLSSDWNGYIPKEYIPISTTQQVLEYLSICTYHNLVWTYKDITDRVPEMEGRIDIEDPTNEDTLYLPYRIYKDIGLSSSILYWLEGSMALIRNIDTYSIIMDKIPPYSCKNRIRKYTYPNDTDFFFQ